MSERLDIVGLSEVSEMTEIATSTLSAWLRRGHMPEPDVRLSCGPIWHRRTIERWRNNQRARIERVQPTTVTVYDTRTHKVTREERIVIS